MSVVLVCRRSGAIGTVQGRSGTFRAVRDSSRPLGGNWTDGARDGGARESSEVVSLIFCHQSSKALQRSYFPNLNKSAHVLPYLSASNLIVDKKYEIVSLNKIVTIYGEEVEVRCDEFKTLLPQGFTDIISIEDINKINRAIRSGDGTVSCGSIPHYAAAPLNDSYVEVSREAETAKEADYQRKMKEGSSGKRKDRLPFNPWSLEAVNFHKRLKTGTKILPALHMCRS
ncbi:hypothetical protein FQR65_LT17417 [Abscondita terminalis]|nr:hypothetical protein FQR65_LT17417 [Abscondita terminalis]